MSQGIQPLVVYDFIESYDAGPGLIGYARITLYNDTPSADGKLVPIFIVNVYSKDYFELIGDPDDLPMQYFNNFVNLIAQVGAEIDVTNGS